MGKNVFIFTVFMVLASFCFANASWKFESGSEAFGYKLFDSVTIINKTGEVLKTEKESISPDSNATFTIDSIVVSCEAANSDSFEIFCAIEDGNLEVVVLDEWEGGIIAENDYPVGRGRHARHYVRPASRHHMYREAPRHSRGHRYYYNSTPHCVPHQQQPY